MTRKSRRGFTLRAGLAALLLAAHPALSQQPKPPPLFPSEVEVVALDVNIVDGEGRPVPDLASSEFSLDVDGHPRRVVSAEFVRQDAGAEAPAAPAPPPNMSSNEGVTPGRLIIIAVDEGNIPVGAGRDVTKAAQRLLERLGPADRVGMVTLPGPEPRQEFTGEHRLVYEALGRVAGRARFAGRRVSVSEALAYKEQDDAERWAGAVRRECGVAADFACARDLEAEASMVAWEYQEQSRRSVAMLASTFEALQRIEGQKVMVLITAGLGLPDGGSRPGRVTPQLHELGLAAAAARVSLFAVQVSMGVGGIVETDMSPELVDDDRVLQSRSLETLAVLARGAVLRGNPDQALARVAREISGYYLLGFEPEGRDRDGKPHDIRVRVSRPGLTVRARRSVAMAPPGSAKDEERTLVAALRAPVAATAIPIRVATYAVREPDQGRSGNVRLLISAEIGRQLAPRGLAVAWVLLDGRGKTAASSVQRERDEVVEGPVPFEAMASVSPGLYTLKIAARDRAGRQGSVEHPVKASLLSAGRLEMSDLMLGLPPAAGGGLRPGLGLDASGGPLVAHLEIYGDAREVAVSFEVARDANAAAVSAQPAHMASVHGRNVAQAIIPLSGLAAGEYLVRAVVSVSGKPVAAAAHPFRVRAS